MFASVVFLGCWPVRMAYCSAGNPKASFDFFPYAGLQRAVDGVVEDLSHTWLFRPWIYLVLTLVLLGFAVRVPYAPGLLLSGLGNEMSLFFLAHSPDYRYSHWMVCTTVLAGILVFADRLRGNPRPLSGRPAERVAR